MNARIGWRLGSFAVGALFIVAWQVMANAHVISPVYLPGPDRTWNALVRGFTNGTLPDQLWQTVQRMFVGWLLASLAGIVVGASIGLSRPARTYLGPTLEFLRPLPASAVIPLGIAFFGLSDNMVLGVIAFGALWPTLLATVHGFAAVEPCLYEVSRALGMSRLAVIWKIALPSSLPDILGGMRLSLTVSLILAVVGEMLASRTGLGSGILIAARTFHAPDLYAGVVLLGGLGYVTAQGLFAVEARLLRWRQTAQ
jgi:sulfonate transport system permease protein